MMQRTQWRMRCSEPVVMLAKVRREGLVPFYLRDNDPSCNGFGSEQSHLPRKIAHSKLEMACCTLQKKLDSLPPYRCQALLVYSMRVLNTVMQKEGCRSVQFRAAV